MPLSVRLTNKEEALLDAASRQTARSRSALVRQAVRELCQRLVRAGKTPFDLGKRLFGAGTFASAPTDPVKRAVWEKLVDAKATQCPHGIDSLDRLKIRAGN